MKIYLYITILFFVIASYSCTDDFADLNSNPSTIAEPDLRFSTAAAINAMYNQKYLNWFYNARTIDFPFSQYQTITRTGNGSMMNRIGGATPQYLYPNLFPQTRDIQHRIDEAKDESYAALKAITYCIQIQPALYNTDYLGGMIYSQAGMAAYTDPPLLTLKIDTQKELFDHMLEELNDCINTLETVDLNSQFNIGNQDIIYKGDYQKWGKFANLLKLKIAARLVNIDRERALDIAEEVTKSKIGYMNALDDDFIWHSGINASGCDNTQMHLGHVNEKLVDMMVKYKDPRIRFTYRKNDFNGQVINAFIETKTKLPSCIKSRIELNADGSFKNYKDIEEPWARYIGASISPDAATKAENDCFFKEKTKNKVTIGKTSKYYSCSARNMRQIQNPYYDKIYPTAPGGAVIEVTEDAPELVVVLGSSAETNLYLAEFKLLGANLPRPAKDYLILGVQHSVERHDWVAKVMEIPYYNSDPVYKSVLMQEKGAVKLRDKEIIDLLNTEICDLSSDGLEKVYIHQLINFMQGPGDHWTTVRRSGIPKRNSKYYPWTPLIANGEELVLPRRCVVDVTDPTDINFKNREEWLKQTGYTPGAIEPEILNKERIWFDNKNPKYGEGPK